MSKKRPTESDPFEVIGKIPDNVTYQWVAHSILGNTEAAASHFQAMVEGGWRPVLPKRHPRMTHKGRRIVVGGQVLMQRPRKLSDAATAENLRIAKAQINEESKQYRSKPGVILPHIDHWRERKFTHAQVVEFKNNLGDRGGLKYVEVTIGVLIDDDEFQMATAHLSLSPQEYIRRRIYMDTDVLVRARNSDWEEMPIFRRGEMFVKSFPMEK